MTGRLQEDHDNARYMAEELAKIPGIHVDLSTVEISMVFFTVDKDADWIAALPARMLEKGIKASGIEDGQFRFVTNHDVTREDVDHVIACMKESWLCNRTADIFIKTPLPGHSGRGVFSMRRAPGRVRGNGNKRL